ncbi:hypothetical protein [Domibacillus aminovorans]|uniref:hypothetical protein n=1 Tax=Domibacillus aminovorans TaxID=29332 RepID=UPI000ADA18AF|nr:hypothetical protein [Domibacillus aminovorans]
MKVAIKNEIFVRKFSEEEVKKKMIKEGYSLESDLCRADVAQYFRECIVCGDYVDVNDQ